MVVFQKQDWSLGSHTLFSPSHSKLRCDLCPRHAPAGPDNRWAEEMDRTPREEDPQDSAIHIFKGLASLHVHSLRTKSVFPQES